MIVVAVDDLLFSSKIRETARRTGAALVFARTPEAILREIRDGAATLVIFDLDAERLQPLSTIQAIRRDPALAHIRLVGFVSHVRTDVIEAAAASGVDVLPRSAFVRELAGILADQA